MIAAIRTEVSDLDVQLYFLDLLPLIRRKARAAFRRLGAEARDDAITEVVANSFAAFARLVGRGKLDVAFATVLARYAIRQFHAGRRVGSRFSTQDVLSPATRRRRGVVVEQLEQLHLDVGGWADAFVEDRSTPVADQAAFRCDFPVWLRRQSRRDRQIARALALGHTTSEVAERFDLSPGRVSQIRAELRESWLSFHGETERPA